VTNELPEEIVLDEATSPGGVLELVSYTEGGVVWIGVKPQRSPLKQTIGLYTRSREPSQPWIRSFDLFRGSGERRPGAALRGTRSDRARIAFVAAVRTRRRQRTRRDNLRSARILPPVWHVGQYVTSCDS
jgi:hypothetical protein